jgi:hypothetical protein
VEALSLKLRHSISCSTGCNLCKRGKPELLQMCCCP